MRDLIIKNKVERINKRKGGKVALLMFAVLAVGLLAGCAPEVAHASPTDSPVATQSTNPTNTPALTITASPTSTPEPTPGLTREEALKKLNITSEELYALSDLVMYECILKDGREVRFLVKGYSNGETSEGHIGEDYNVLDDELFASYIVSGNSLGDDNMQDSVDIKLVPKFLEGAKVKMTYNLSSIPYFYPERNEPIPSSPYLDFIIKCTSSGGDPYELTRTFINSTECANLLLDIVPYDKMLWAKDYVEGFVDPIETTQKQSNRNINPVKNGYKTLGYYNSRNTGTKYNVNLINHPFKNHAMRKI